MTRRKSTSFYLFLWIFKHRALQGTTGATYRPHVCASQAKSYLQTRARYFRLEVCSVAAKLETSDLFREVKLRYVNILVRSLRQFRSIDVDITKISQILWNFYLDSLDATIFLPPQLFRRPQRGYWRFIKEITHRINRLRLSHLKRTKTDAWVVKFL